MGAAAGPDIIENGLVLCLDAGNKDSYPSAGTAWTDLAGSNNGTLTNGPTFNSANGGSIVFDGTNDEVQLSGTNLSLNQMTISCWNYSTNYNQNGFMFEKTTNGNVNTQYSLFFNNNNTIYFRTANLTSYDTTLNTNTGGVLNNQWNNVVAVYDGAFKHIYINGILKLSVGCSGTVLQNNTGIALIGRHGIPSNYAFNGRIAQTQIYNRALTPAEILQNYNATKGRFLL